MNPQSAEDEKNYFRETTDVQFLKEKAKSEHFRITQYKDQRRPNWYAYHKIQNMNGYQGAKIRVYEELTKRINWEVLYKLMNVRYIVSSENLRVPGLILRQPQVNYGDFRVFEYINYLSRAYFPREVVVINEEDSVLSKIASGRFNPEFTAIIEEEPPFEISASYANSANITSYDIHRIEIDVNVKTPSMLVLSDIFYPAGWKAYVDGRETRIYKTNYAFRSVFLRPGSNKIVFQFKPVMFRAGLGISITTGILLLLGTGFGWWLEKKKRSGIPEGQES